MKLSNNQFPIFIGIITTGFIFLFGVLLYLYLSYQFDGIKAAWIVIPVFSLAITFLSWRVRKQPYFAYTLLISSCLLTVLIIYKVSDNGKYQTEYIWTAEHDTIIVPFTTNPDGRICLKSHIGDTSALFLFDTGAGITILDERLLKGQTVHNHTLTDAKKIQRTKRLIRTDMFKLGDISFSNLNIWPADSAAWDKGGWAENLDDAVGILGQNVIFNFKWDFDMVNKTTTISHSGDKISPFLESLGVSLDIKNNKRIEVNIDDDYRQLTIDFGYSGAIALKDSFPRNPELLYQIGDYSNSAFSHTIQVGVNETDTVFYNIKSVNLGGDLFKSVACNGGKKHNLLGVQFFWAYERVILDYPNKKLFLLNKREEGNGKNDVRQRSLDLIQDLAMQMHGHIDFSQSELDVKRKWITNKGDTVDGSFVFYHKMRFYGKSTNAVDSIVGMDSVLLPNGQMRYGPYLLQTSKKYYREI